MTTSFLESRPDQRIFRASDLPTSTPSRLARAGRLVRVLPGTYVRASDVTVRWVRWQAACTWAPDACLWGRAAVDAATGGLAPFGAHETITLAGTPKPARAGIAWYAAYVPPEFVHERDGVRFAKPLVAAVALAATDGGVALDRLLMTQPALGEDLADVLAWFGGRAGNRARRVAVSELRQRPWSGLERELHRLLRSHRIGGWVANPPTRTPFGWFVPDVLFEAERLVVEVDSWEYHSSAAAFESDRSQQNRMVLAGYHVLRFTGDMIDNRSDYVIQTIRRLRRDLRRRESRPL